MIRASIYKNGDRKIPLKKFDLTFNSTLHTTRNNSSCIFTVLSYGNDTIISTQPFKKGT
jgi:hypothetical protein